MKHPWSSHIDEEALKVLVPSDSEGAREPHTLSSDALRESVRHIDGCENCKEKVSIYRELVNRSPNVVISEAVPPGTHCPSEEDVDWHEVAAGLWPELKARQLILHAALCDHCGPLLRAATSVDDEPTLEEELLLVQLAAPSRPLVQKTVHPISRQPAPATAWRPSPYWKVLLPALALIAIVGIFVTRPSSSPALSGAKLAEFAVNTHRQYALGKVALDVRSDSQQTINNWFKTRLPFNLALPASPPLPGEQRPFKLQGARLVPVMGKTAASIAYQLQTGPASLLVAPDSVAVASGGVEVDFKKVSFHYQRVEGYRVVTWSQHGLTYTLVSHEDASGQTSCMVCHSAMRDRDLSHTPAPFRRALDAPDLLMQ